MEDVLKSMAAQSPGVVALVIVVLAFIKYTSKMSEQHGNRTNEFIAMVQNLNQENKEARQHSREVIEKNTAALAAIEKVVERCAIHQRRE